MGREPKVIRKALRFQRRLSLSVAIATSTPASGNLLIKSSGPLNSCRRCFLGSRQEDKLDEIPKKTRKGFTFPPCRPILAEPNNISYKGVSGTTAASLKLKRLPHASSSKAKFRTLAQKVLANGINQSCVDFLGKSPLHIAIERGNLNLASDLINGGVDLDCTDAAGKTPLYYAITRNDYSLVVTLLERGASADKSSAVTGDAIEIVPSPFHFARSQLTCLRNSVSIVDWASIFEMIRILRALKAHVHNQNIVNRQIDDLCDHLQSSLSVTHNPVLVPANSASKNDAWHGSNATHALDTVDKINGLLDRLNI